MKRRLREIDKKLEKMSPGKESHVLEYIEETGKMWQLWEPRTPENYVPPELYNTWQESGDYIFLVILEKDIEPEVSGEKEIESDKSQL